MTDDRLTTREHWERQWSERSEVGLSFDPEHPEFAEIHGLLRRHLRPGGGRRVLEVGAFPGTYLWYFARHFEYAPHGLEYLPDGCVTARRLLREAGVDAQIHEGDLFDPEVLAGETFDVVASFGFVEHFADSTPAVRRHVELLRPGGHLVLTIPNHSGLGGAVLRAIDRPSWDAHNHMTAEALRAAVERVGGVEILEWGYYGRFGLRNTGLYGKLRRAPYPLYVAARAPLFVLERAARWLPNTRVLAPVAALVGRKR